MKKLLITILLLGLAGCSQPKINNDLGAIERTQKINAIVDMVAIGENTKTIAYTDENVGENFIIKTDNKDYYSLGGDVLVDFSVTNVSATDQDANIVFSLGKNQTVRNVERFAGNRSVVSYTEPTATTTSEKIIKEPVWETVIFNKFDVSKSSLTRKDTKGRVVDKTFQDNFKVGETKYYRVSMIVPYGITENEWFIEAFGSTAYGNLDPNNWTYEQNFNSLSDGDINGQDSWTGTAGVEVQTTTKYEGAKALQMVHNGVAQNAQREITTITSGSVYVAMMKTDNNSDESNFQLRNSGGASIIANIKFSSGGQIQYYNSGYSNLLAYTANQWYILNIEFDHAVQGDKYRVRVYNGSSWGAFTSYVDCGLGAWDTVGRVHVEKQTGNGNYSYWDIITPNDPTIVASTPTLQDQDVLIFD